MNKRTNKQTNEQTNERTKKWQRNEVSNEWRNKQTNKRKKNELTNKRTQERKNEQTNKRTNEKEKKQLFAFDSYQLEFWAGLWLWLQKILPWPAFRRQLDFSINLPNQGICQIISIFNSFKYHSLGCNRY